MDRVGVMLTLLLCLSGCAKGTDAWLADLEGQEVFARLLAAAALGEAPPGEHRQAVSGLLGLRFEDDPLRGRAMGSLRSLASRSPEVFIELLEVPPYLNDSDVLLDALVGAGEPVVPALIRALQTGPINSRTALAVALGRLGHMSHPAVVEWIEQGSVAELEVAIAGVNAAGRGRAARNLALRLVTRLQDGTHDAGAQREAVLSAVENVTRDSKLAAQGLISALVSVSDVDRDALTAAVFSGLLEGLRRGTHEFSDARLLVDALEARAIPHLVSVLERDNEKTLKQWAASALGGLGRAALQPVLQSAADEVWVDDVLAVLNVARAELLQLSDQTQDARVRERAQRAASRLPGG